ncbi:hypothetical protein RBH29_01265 [Herbivorax sp. ANBcel31]|uniref:hypothetical protein n=1 Tax=Herbivorax sp. ANBcel31 TaxID=3069754 RepID=UPI0027B72318|nr:hypothetical protein [Herbivorax sp. ANBcel31]MDQ2085067.1 hypothetical protein [Herbivorax sp. ANBcel31]
MEEGFINTLNKNQNKKGFKFIMRIMIFLFISSLLVSCQNKKLDQQESLGLLPENDVEVVKGMALSKIGASLPNLCYASEDIAVIYDYWGIIVYDLKEHRICRAVDLITLDTKDTQDDWWTNVTVNKEGTHILIERISRIDNSTLNYIYDIEKDDLKKTDKLSFDEGEMNNLYNPHNEEINTYLEDIGVNDFEFCGDIARVGENNWIGLSITELRQGDELCYDDMRQMTLVIVKDDSVNSKQVFDKFSDL